MANAREDNCFCSSCSTNEQAGPSSSNPFHRGRRQPRHPSYLKGRAIGMFYAQMQKEKKKHIDGIYISINREIKQKIKNFVNESDIRRYVPLFTNRATYRDSYIRDSFHRYPRHSVELIDLEEETPKYVPRACVLPKIPNLDEKLYNNLHERKKDHHFMEMKKIRKSLPAYELHKKIPEVLEDNQVIFVTGETGSGKTTQVPQYILDYFIKQKRGSLCKIVCTQPRRISAITVAERVADERAVVCGNDSDVGYQIRLESKFPRQQGSILYCTTGIMLRHLQSSLYLAGISHIIMDEIHERSLDSDFLLIILRDIISKRKDLKLILMSATLNSQELIEYFGDCPVLKIKGFAFPVTVNYLEDVIEETRYCPEPKENDEPEERWKKLFRKENEYQMEDVCDEKEIYLRYISHSYSKRTRDVLRQFGEQMEKRIDYNLIVHLLKFINSKKEEGAVLVFLPGWQDIVKLRSKLFKDDFFQHYRFRIIPLHSLMPTINQKDVFSKSPDGVQKIILATNIAETSVTIEDVVHVIDSGKIKMNTYDSLTNMTVLKPEWISISNAKQRRGRAGRTQPGTCYHLYTKLKEGDFDEYQKPEILRITLERVILDIKLLKLGDIQNFLKKAIQPPDVNAVVMSIIFLQRLKILSTDEMLTPLGYMIARIPVDPQIGRMLLFGAMFSCLDPILSVCAWLSFKDAFMIPIGKEELVDDVRHNFTRGSQSDHIMFANSLKEYEKAVEFGEDFSFCYDNFLSKSTLKMLKSLKVQFAEHLRDLHFLINPDYTDRKYNINSDNITLVKAVICAGLYPNVARIYKRDCNKKHHRSIRAVLEDGTYVDVHPKSTIAYDPCIENHWLVYHQKMRSSKVYLYDATVSYSYPLLLFGGKLIANYYDEYEKITVDNWIKFSCPTGTAKIILALQEKLEYFFKYKISNPGISNWDPSSDEGALLQCITDFISSEKPPEC